MAKTKRPGTVWALIALTAIQALGGIGGGVGLVRDPVNNIGLPIEWLEGSPFKDYLIPGLTLLVVLGLFPLLVLYGIVRRRRWSWWLSVAVGAGLVIWIITEVAVVGYQPGVALNMQIGFGLVGVAILVLALVRPTRRFFRVGGHSQPRGGA